MLWQSHSVKSSISSAFKVTTARNKEAEMEARLRANPMDAEANKYFGDKIRLKQVNEQVRQEVKHVSAAIVSAATLHHL